MSGEDFIPSMSQAANTDSIVLTTSLADYRKTLVDNVYNDVPALRILNEAGRKRMIDGGVSVNNNGAKEIWLNRWTSLN